jgi:hypothetical protein
LDFIRPIGSEPELDPVARVQRLKDEREERERRAKAICRDCAVRRECLDYAMSIRELHGIWGGLTEAERRSVLAREAG